MARSGAQAQIPRGLHGSAGRLARCLLPAEVAPPRHRCGAATAYSSSRRTSARGSCSRQSCSRGSRPLRTPSSSTGFAAPYAAPAYSAAYTARPHACLTVTNCPTVSCPSTAQPLHNALLDTWLLRRRARAGATFVRDRGSLAQLTAHLRDGGLVCLLADQRPSPRQRSVRATFLGRDARFAAGAGALHEATGAAVWFGALLLEPSTGSSVGLPTLRLVLERLAEGVPGLRAAPARRCASAGGDVNPLHRQFTSGEPSDASVGDAGLAVLLAYAHALSRHVERHNEQYFWWHRRWRDEPGELAEASPPMLAV